MKNKLFLAVFTVITILTFPVLSQEEEDESYEKGKDTVKKTTALEEIVITGTRTEKKIIDIPYSVFRVEKKELLFGRDFNAKDILQDVPGLFLQTKYGSDVRISIRGFGTHSTTGVRGIRILLDGFTESEPDGESSMDAIDYSSLGGVEVVKGNQSSLYPNSPGGVINFLTDLSFSSPFVKTSNQFGSFDLYQNGIRAGLTGDNSKLFVSYTYKNYKGYREHGSEFTHLLNSHYVAYLNPNSSFTVSGNYSRGFIRFPGALTQEEFDANPRQAYFQAVSSDFKRITQKGRLGLKYKTNWGKNKANEIEVLGFGAIKDIEFTTNIYYNIKYKYVLGSTFRYTNRGSLLKRENEFTAGFDYNYVTGPLTSFANINGVKGDDLQAQNTETQTNYGAFALNQFNLYKGKLYLLLSGRYDKVKISNNDELFAVRNSSRGFERFTPKAGFNYKLTPTVSAYTSFGFGFDTPSAAELENFIYSSDNGIKTLNPDLQPQTSKNFEIGIKGNIFNRGSKFLKKALFELTFFNTQVNDEIIPVVVTDRVFYRNAAKTNRLGFESGIKIEPFERTDLIVNYTYTNFKYDKYISRVYTGTGNPIDVDYSGNRVPAVPQHLVNFIFEAEPELAKHLDLLMIFDCDYVSKMYADDQNSTLAGDYVYANLMGGVEYKGDNLNFIISGGFRNIFDRKYAGFLNINANPELPQSQRRYFELGEPRNFYMNLTFTYKFQ